MKILLFLFATHLANVVCGRVINDNLIRSSMTCDNFVFTNAPRDIRAAAEAAQGHFRNNQTVGPNPQNQYPKRFGNAEQLPLAPGCVATALSEYPLTNVIPYQNLSQPGRFRVVVNLLTNSTDVRLCTVMFHRQSDQRFVGCAWRTDVQIIGDLDQARLREQL